jgi:hypothetical protein
MYSPCDSGEDSECDDDAPATECVFIVTDTATPCTDDSECGPAQVCNPNTQVCADIRDGFCTIEDCIDPATDCDPSPGGTATPMCYQDWCVLDCAFKACPTGMSCYELGSGDSICG